MAARSEKSPRLRGTDGAGERGKRGAISPRDNALLCIRALVAVLPSSPGWSATYDDTLTRDDRSHIHEVSVEEGTLHAELTFEPTVEVRALERYDQLIA